METERQTSTNDIHFSKDEEKKKMIFHSWLEFKSAFKTI